MMQPSFVYKHTNSALHQIVYFAVLCILCLHLETKHVLAFEAPDPIEKSVPKAHNHGDDTTCDSMKADYETTIQTLKKSLHDAEKEIKHLKAEIESPANPAEAEIHRLQTEIDKLYRQERKRQQRVQHQDADTKDNGPKEISIFCKDPPAVSITDLEDEQRDKDECMVLNVNAPELSSRLILYCDGHTTMPEWTPQKEGWNDEHEHYESEDETEGEEDDE